MQKRWKCCHFDATMMMRLHHILCTYFSADASFFFFFEEPVTYFPLNFIFTLHRYFLPPVPYPLRSIVLSLRSHFHLFPISSCTYVFILAEQQVLECLFKRGIAQCVTSRVDGRVDVTQPISNCPHSVWHTGLAEGWDQHHDVIWCPRNDESQQDGKDRLGHLWSQIRNVWNGGWIET